MYAIIQKLEAKIGQLEISTYQIQSQGSNALLAQPITNPYVNEIILIFGKFVDSPEIL